VGGKPVFVWFSIDTHAKGLDKIRWERLFTTVHGEGENTSYFYHFLVLLFSYLGYQQYKKRKKSMH
jgi:signal peptidase I